MKWLLQLKKPNSLGLYYMSGYVFECLQDGRNKTYNGASTDGTSWDAGDCTNHVNRGGYWFNKQNDLLSTNRNWYFTTDVWTHTGFRLAQD